MDVAVATAAAAAERGSFFDSTSPIHRKGSNFASEKTKMIALQSAEPTRY